MRKWFLFYFVIIALSMCGCSKSDAITYTDNTKVFQVPLLDEGYVEFLIPEELSVLEEDGQALWKLSDGTVITLEKFGLSKGKEIEGNCTYSDKGVFYTLPNNDGVLSVLCDKSHNEYYRKSLNNLSYIKNTLLKELYCTEDNLLGKLPTYVEQDMVVTNNSLYMPAGYEDSTINIYTACYYNIGNQFIESWIMYFRLEDLIPKLLPKVLCNSTGELTAWYEDNEVFYLETDSYVLGAKKITHNQWCCYMSSNTPDMKNYLLQGLNKVHFSGD